MPMVAVSSRRSLKNISNKWRVFVPAINRIIMKARVKATGEIVEISEDCSYVYAEHFDKSYNINELEFLPLSEKSFPKEEDYWTRLEHQYVGMAMQGILSSKNLVENISRHDIGLAEGVARVSKEMAHALVEKIKEERK